MNWRKEIRDQSAHVAVVFAAILPAGIWPSLITYTWAGLIIALLAEVKERGSTVTIATLRAAFRSRLDLTAYTLAGLVSWFIVSSMI